MQKAEGPLPESAADKGNEDLTYRIPVFCSMVLYLQPVSAFSVNLLAILKCSMKNTKKNKKKLKILLFFFLFSFEER